MCREFPKSQGPVFGALILIVALGTTEMRRHPVSPALGTPWVTWPQRISEQAHEMGRVFVEGPTVLRIPHVVWSYLRLQSLCLPISEMAGKSYRLVELRRGRGEMQRGRDLLAAGQARVVPILLLTVVPRKAVLTGSCRPVLWQACCGQSF